MTWQELADEIAKMSLANKAEQVRYVEPYDDDNEGYFPQLHFATKPIVVHCHHGGRSETAVRLLLSRGFARVENLEGGIEAWSLTVDPRVSRY